MAKHERGDRHMEEEGPDGPLGRFVLCCASEEAHREKVAVLVYQTTDRRGKTRFNALCPVCNTRAFLNKWKRWKGKTLIEAEERGWETIGLDEEYRDELLAELGLKRAPRVVPRVVTPRAVPARRKKKRRPL